jgi:hypothetical protein
MNHLVKQLYLDLGMSRNTIPNKDVLYNLFESVPKDKGENLPHIQTNEAGEIVQSDTLYLPEDEGYHYALVVVDCGNRALDAEPLKKRDAKTVLAALKKIFKRGIVKEPSFQLQVDSGTEFKSEVKNYFERKGIIVRVAQTGRHRQVALAEGMNHLIGKLIMMRQLGEELLTNVKSTEWIDDLPKIVKAINARVKLNHPRYTLKEMLKQDPIGHGDACSLYDIGTKVRVALDVPEDYLTGKRLIGSFRAGDQRWEKEPRTITGVLLNPNMPPMYTVSGKYRVSYTKNQLQLVPEKEEQPPATIQTKFVINKIVGKKTLKGKVYYKINWRGYGPEKDTWEVRTELAKTAPLLIEQYEAGLKKPKTKGKK